MKPKFRLALAAALPLALVSYSQAQSTFLNAADGGTWGNADNWSAGTPDAIDAEAIVNGTGPSGTNPATWALDVLLDGTYTVGKLTRTANTGPDTTARAATFPTSPTQMDPTKGLTLQSSSGQPQLDITTGDVFFYSALFGTQGFEKTGNGRFTFRFNTIDQTYTGDVKISGGTLGIEKNSSLGDSANTVILQAGTASNTRLFAEPGNNSSAVTLPASRSITLRDPNPTDGFRPQIGANPAAVALTIQGNISEGDTGVTLQKTDAGTLILSGTNSWTGGTRISAGILRPTSPASLPGYTEAPLVIDSTLSLPLGGTGEWTFGQIDELAANSQIEMGPNGVVQFDLTNATEPVTLDAELPFAGVGKTGSQPLILNEVQMVLQRLNLAGGEVRIGPNGGITGALGLTLSGGGAWLDMGGNNLTLGSLAYTTGTTGIYDAGDLDYAGGNLTFTSNNGGIIDLSDSTSFSYGVSVPRTELTFRANNEVDNSNSTTRLSAGTNTLVTSTRIQLGGGPSSGNGTHLNTVELGTTNTLRTPLLQLGAFNGGGTLRFLPDLENPSLRLRAENGTDAATSLIIGSTNSGVRPGRGILDGRSGSLDLLANTILIGEHFANSNNGSTSQLFLDAGSITTTTLTLAEKRGGGDPVLGAEVIQSGGTVQTDTVIMGRTDLQGANVPAANQRLRPTYRLSGGTLTTASIVEGETATEITGTGTIRTFEWSGGTLSATPGTDLAFTGEINLDLPATPANPRTFTADAGKSLLLDDVETRFRPVLDTDTASVGSFTSQAAVVLGATLSPVLSGTATLAEGTYTILNYAGQSLTGTFADLPEGATLPLGDGENPQTATIRYADLGGTAVTLTVSGGSSENNYATWAAANGIEGQPFEGDFDNDGISNGVEYALGLNPTANSQPPGQLSGNTITFTKGTEAIANGDVSWILETSTTLDAGSWTSQVTQAAGDATPTISYPFTPGSPARQFARLKVLQVP